MRTLQGCYGTPYLFATITGIRQRAMRFRKSLTRLRGGSGSSSRSPKELREPARELDSSQKRIKEDFMGGVRSGVNGTPTFYVNGVRHDGDAVAKALVEA